MFKEIIELFYELLNCFNLMNFKELCSWYKDLIKLFWISFKETGEVYILVAFTIVFTIVFIVYIPISLFYSLCQKLYLKRKQVEDLSKLTNHIKGGNS